MIQSHEHKLTRQWSVILLAALAMVITQSFRFESHWSGWVVFVESILTLAIVIGLSQLFRLQQVDVKKSAKRHLLGLLVIVLLPIVVQGVTRSLGIGDPNELVLLIIVQNATISLAVMPFSLKSVQISGLLSGFLVLFITAMTDNALIWGASVIFAALGLWWLMCSYWNRLETKFASSSHRKIPLRPVMISLTLLVGLGTLTIFTVGTSGTTFVLPGFMPTSGGDKYQDANARSGVGEGDMLIAAEDSAFSFGPVDSEILLESKMPSLYDVASDQYGEARTKKQINKELSQSVSLTSDRLRHNHQKTAVSEQAVRQFSTVRRLSSKRRVNPENRTSTALFQIAGRTPLHLVTRRFDSFDGIHWSHRGRKSTPIKKSIVFVAEKPWLNITRNGGTILQGKQAHTLRIINLKSKQIPSPSHLTGIHIADVDREDFFKVAEGGILELSAQNNIPSLTVIHLLSQTHSESEIIKLGDFRNLYPALTQETEILDFKDKEVAKLSKHLTQNVDPGWQQVSHVTSHLRNEFTHDRQATAPESCQDILEHFLSTKRGPDYMFATAATQILRTLGYEAQVVMGFYADPLDYDSQAKQTVIESNDLHFWTEVHIGHNVWIPIEPTPGYEPTPGWLSWKDKLSIAYMATYRWTTDNWGVLALAISVLFATFWRRHTLFDFGSKLLWRVGWFGTTQRRIIWTMRILEVRARVAGKRRPAYMTLSKWYRATAGGEYTLQHNCDLLETILVLVNQALYSPRIGGHNYLYDDKAGIYSACSQLLGIWTSHRMKRSTISFCINEVSRNKLSQ